MDPSAECGAQCTAWCAAGAIVWLCVVVRFVLQRWQSVAMGVRANIDRFNAIDAERRDRDAAELVRRSGGCYRCLAVVPPPPPESATIRPGTLNISGSTVTESDTDPLPIVTPDQQHNGNGTPPAVVSSTRRRLISITRNHSIDPPSKAVSTAAVAAVKSGDMKIFEICRTRSIVSRLAKRFENNNGLERSVSNGSANNATHHEAAEATTTASPAPPATENFFVFEKTDVFAVPADNQPIITRRAQSFGEIADTDEASSPTMSSISTAEDDFHAEPDDNWLRRSMDDILEECQRTDNEVQMRRRSFEDAANRKAGVGGAAVRTFDEVMRQERFSKCYSEYSISDLLKELADGEGEADAELADADLASILARIQ